MASDLRIIAAVFSIIADLERMGTTPRVSPRLCFCTTVSRLSSP